MILFLKNFIRYFCQKKIILFSGFLILFFLSLPLPALAMWTWLRDAILFVPYLFVAISLVVPILITGGIAFLMGAILDWVISPAFVSLSYTRPCPGPANCNPIIGLGLNITQSFVNLILVVILVYIALSIALRIGEYDAKKLFPRLIAVALLVNFAPVVCGLIVDASNIIMNYFLEPIRGGVSGVLLQVGALWDAVIKSIWGAGGEIVKRLGVLAMAGAQIFLNIAIAFALFLFAGLFIFRYVALWVLVILAPLAFVFWILPATKKFWDMWWNNFIQWSIIGIPMAFFLYLALGSFSVLSEHFRADLEAPGIESIALGFFNQLFPFFVVIAFLGVGFAVGLATSAMGASATIAMTKKGGAKVGKWAGRGGAEVFRRATAGKGPEWLARQATAKLPSWKEFKEKGWGGKITTVAGYATGATFARWGIQRGLGVAGLRMTEGERAAIKKDEESLKGAIPETKASALRRPGLPSTRRIAALRQAIEEGQVGDLRKLGITDDEIIKIGGAALNIHPEEFKKIRDAFPHLAEKMGEGLVKRRLAKGLMKAIQEKAGLTLTDEDRAARITSIPMKIIAKIKPEFIPKLDEEALADHDVSEAIHRFGTGSHISKLFERFGKKFLDDFHHEAEVLGGMPWYNRNNPRLATWLKSTAARGLGVEVPGQRRAREETFEAGAGI